MTNSFCYVMFKKMLNMLGVISHKASPKRRKVRELDLVRDQVRKILSDANQSLITMVRG